MELDVRFRGGLFEGGKALIVACLNVGDVCTDQIRRDLTGETVFFQHLGRVHGLIIAAVEEKWRGVAGVRRIMVALRAEKRERKADHKAQARRRCALFDQTARLPLPPINESFTHIVITNAAQSGGEEFCIHHKIPCSVSWRYSRDDA